MAERGGHGLVNGFLTARHHGLEAAPQHTGIEVHVGACRVLPAEIARHGTALEPPPQEIVAVEADRSVDALHLVAVVETGEMEAGSGAGSNCRVRGIHDRIGKPADRTNERYGTEAHGVELRQPAGFVSRSVNEDVGRCERPWVSIEAKLALDILLAEPLRAKVAVPIGERDVWVRPGLYVFASPIGHSVPVLLLDTDLEENHPDDRRITDRLYGDGDDYRLKQEIVLGIGGLRLLSAPGFAGIHRHHLNEGHAALLAFDLLRRYPKPADQVQPGELMYDVRAVRERCIFTTHTPVEAGPARLRRYARLDQDDGGRRACRRLSWRSLCGTRSACLAGTGHARPEGLRARAETLWAVSPAARPPFALDRFHQAGIGVLLDWVPGHFPGDAHGLARFDGTCLYEHEDERLGRHRDWDTLIYNYGRREVANFLIANALYWLTEFHLDGLKIDAVASMLYRDYSRDEGEWLPNAFGDNRNLEAIEFLQDLNHCLYTECPETITIAEESTSWLMVSRPPETGGLGSGYKWNMGWMNDTLRYMHHDPVHRSYHHGDLTYGMLYAFSENFVLPLSHDEVVHGKGSLLDKMPGEAGRNSPICAPI